MVVHLIIVYMLFDNITNECIEHINECIKSGEKINDKLILSTCKKVYDANKKKNTNIKFDVILKIIKQTVSVKYKVNKNAFDTKCIRDCEYMFSKLKIPPEYKKITRSL